MITAPMFFDDAINFLLGKEDLPSDWSSKVWQDQEPEFRNKAFFSATMEKGRFLDRAHGLIFDHLAGVEETIIQPDGTKVTALKTFDRAHFVERMQKFMLTEGMVEKGDFAKVNQSDVRDIRSLARLNLIFDTNVKQAYGFGQWKQGQVPAVLEAYPAGRLVRDRGVMEPRLRHEVNLDEVNLKNDPRWATYHNNKDIGGFGVPWGPYGFNSGVNQEDVSREEAQSLGLAVDSVTPQDGRITDGTQAGTKRMDPDIKAKLLAELRSGPQPQDPAAAGKRAAENTRRIMLQRGIDDAISRGDAEGLAKYRQAFAALPERGLRVVDDGDSIRLE